MTPKETKIAVVVAVIGAAATLGAGAIQAFGPGWFKDNKEATLQTDVAGDVVTPAPQPVANEKIEVVPEAAPQEATPAPAAPEAPADVINAPAGSRVPTFKTEQAVASVKKKFGGSGNVRAQLVANVELENNSSEPIRFLVMTAETSLMLDAKTQFRIEDVSTRLCTMSVASACRRNFHDRYTEMAPGERRPVAITFWGDITPANLAALPEAAKANFTLGLSVIYNEGEDEVVRLSDTALKVDAAALK